MTVCVGIAVNDCLVFAADSASTLVQTDPKTGESVTLNVYQNGDKVFNLCKKLPLLAMTCGMGNIASASIATLAKEFRHRLSHGGTDWQINKEAYSVEEVAQKACTFLFGEKFSSWDQKPSASLEFWVGGYSSDHSLGHEVWKVVINNGECAGPEKVLDCGATGLSVGGQLSPITRLVVGFDGTLGDALIEMGAAADQISDIINFFRQKLEVRMVMPTMPVKDAIDLADFLVETTKRYFRFLPGADIVGGDTDIAVVTRYEGFKWIKRKHFYCPSLNPLETDHV